MGRHFICGGKTLESSKQTHIGKMQKKIDKGVGISSGTPPVQSDGKPLRPALRVAVSRAMATAQCGEKRSTDHGNGDHE